jgi:hypothetical protein
MQYMQQEGWEKHEYNVRIIRRPEGLLFPSPVVTEETSGEMRGIYRASCASESNFHVKVD